MNIELGLKIIAVGDFVGFRVIRNINSAQNPFEYECAASKIVDSDEL